MPELEARARELIDVLPEAGLAWKVLGAALLRQGKDPLPALAKATKLLPKDAETHNLLGNALSHARRHGEALASYRRALTLQPRFAEVHSNVGNVMCELGRLDEAVASYRRALNINLNSAEAHNNLGNALRGLGQRDAALASYRRALAVDPGYAEAHNNLGSALGDGGQLAEAIASYRRALAIRSDYAEAHANLGSALRRVGQLEEAAASYRRALELQPHQAEHHNNVGNTLMELGRPEEAVALYRQAVAIKPDYAEAHSNLGAAFRDLGQLDAALASLQRALELSPDLAQAHLNLALVFKQQGRRSDAEASCRRALDLKPDSAAATTLRAELYTDEGRFVEAQTLFERAITLDPDSPDAWVGMVQIRKMTDRDAAWLSAAQRILAHGLPPRRELNLRYALGKYFDDVRDYGQAFAHYQRANELEQPLRPKHDRQLLRKTFELTMHSFAGDWLATRRRLANASARPVFIVGMPRSGTSLTEQILASHPAVFGAGELMYWTQAATAHGAYLLGDAMSEEVISTLANDYLRLLDRLAPDALRVLDKMPGNFMFLGLINAALPNARIIHMQRNPLDTCLSIYFQHFEVGHSYGNDLGDLADCYAGYARVMQHWRRTLPADAMLDVPYERLVADPELWSRKMLAFIDLPWDPSCIEFYETKRSVVTASKWQVRQKMSGASVERWRNYEKFLEPLLPLLDLDLGGAAR